MTAVSHNFDSQQLTVTARKRKLFAQDLYLREGWAELLDVAGDRAAEIDALALLTFKPEAVPGRRMRTTLDFLIEHEFSPVAVAPVRYTRHSMRELWRYDWDRYSTDRLALATVMYTAGESLLLVLHDDARATGLPAAMRLSRLRGPAAPADRQPGELRELLRPPNEVLNFVHVADEPVDVVRELGIFLDRDERRELLEIVGAGDDARSDPLARTLAEIERLEQACAPHDLDLEHSLWRVAQAGHAASDAVARLRTVIAHGEMLRWDELRAAIDPADERIDVWDFILIACHVLELWR